MCEGVTDRVVHNLVFLKKKNKDNGVTRPQPCLGRARAGSVEKDELPDSLVGEPFIVAD